MTKNPPRPLLAAFDTPGSLRWRLRCRRIEPLMEMIESVHRERGSVRLIDIGGTHRFWAILPAGFLEAHRVHITIVNLPSSAPQQRLPAYRYVDADGCDLAQFGDRSFDIAHSNSVLEHVGDWQRMKAFACEIRRVADSYFVQTPNYWFPIEPHSMAPLIHWLPKPLRLWLVMRFRMGYWRQASTLDEGMCIIEGERLLTKDMFAALFPNGRLLCERFFLLPKSYTSVGPSGMNE